MKLNIKNNNKIFTKVIFLSLLIFLSIPISYSLINNINNQNSMDINEVERKLQNFDPYQTHCVTYNQIKETLGDKSFVLLPRDIYLSESIRNLSCATKIVDYYSENNSQEIILFFGRNNKVNLIYTLSIFFIFVLSAFFKNHYYFLASTLFYQINLNILNAEVNNIFNLFLTTLFLYVVFFLFLLFFKSSYFNESISNLNSKVANFNLKVPDLNIKEKVNEKISVIFLLMLSFVLGIKEFISKTKYEYFNDELIVLLTSARMKYLDLTSIQSTIKHHTPFNSQIFKIVFDISEYSEFLTGIVMLEIIYSLITSVLLFFTLNKINKNNLLSLIFSSGFLIFMSSQLLLNRQIAHLIYILLIFLLFYYIENRKDSILFLITFVSILQIYNLETYALPIIFLLLSLFALIFDSFFMYVKTFAYACLSTLLIYLNFFLNGEFYQLFMSNYYFHLFNTIRGSSIEKLFIAIGFSKNFSLKHIIFILILTRIFYIIKNRKFSENYIETMFSFWFLGELMQIILSGPRSMHYGLVLATPTVFLVYYYLSNAKHLKNSVVFIIAIVFLFGNFPVSVSGTAALFKDNTQVQIEDIVDEVDKVEINRLILKEGNPIPILTWVHPNDWKFVHLSTNTLPATRYWYWFYMKYFPKENKYNWEGNWNEKEIIYQWKSDLEMEQPKYALIDKNMDQYPYFFEEVLDTNYQIIYESEKWTLYKLLSLINS